MPLFIKIHELVQNLAGLAQRLYTDGHTNKTPQGCLSFERKMVSTRAKICTPMENTFSKRQLLFCLPNSVEQERSFR
jgi:hypothetical protein